MSRRKKGRVFVGLSGGIDSSVSAVLLKEKDYDVVGVFIKVWQADFLPCNWREERRMAMHVAAHLQIPFVTLDLEKNYKSEVVDYMVKEYQQGRTPNPDVMCNKHVKFGAFLDFALQNGATHIATGHYAVIQKNGEKFMLSRGNDPLKDQSYFLWTLSQKELKHSLFPVGEMKKSEVRQLGKKFNLPNAEKKDSQGLCFMGPINIEDFLRHFLELKPGKVLNEEGVDIGEHQGALIYTIGQRHGFTTRKTSTNELPYFIIAKNMQENTITVSHSLIQRTNVSTKLTMQISDLNVNNDYVYGGAKLTGQVRYHGENIAIIVHEVSKETMVISFENNSEAINRGQSIVFYAENLCVGGGIITEIK